MAASLCRAPSRTEEERVAIVMADVQLTAMMFITDLSHDKMMCQMF